MIPFIFSRLVSSSLNIYLKRMVYIVEWETGRIKCRFASLLITKAYGVGCVVGVGAVVGSGWRFGGVVVDVSGVVVGESGMVGEGCDMMVR